MNKKLLTLILASLMLPAALMPQVKPAFSGDPARFREELVQFMGENLSPEHNAILSTFLAKWDSAAFSKENMTRILDLSTQLTGRQIRAVPQFSQFLKTLTDFTNRNRDDAFLGYWLTGFSELLFNPRFSNESITRYIKNTSSLLEENLIFSSGSVKWKVKGAELRFIHDTIFHIDIRNATLTCYSQRDSTEIYNASGTYYPDLQVFRGSKGTVTWEKAGFAAEDVFAEIHNYTINTTRNSFTCDSARLTHKTYFREPVYGILTDQAASVSNKERSIFPQFETYTSQFVLDNIYEGVSYEGGLAFEGAQTRGKGNRSSPAKITLSRNDTLFIKITANEFTFTRVGLTSAGTESTLYLGKDSIYHSNLGFSYNANDRQVSLFRTNNPVSASPYYDTYHNLDMYFENLSWDMNTSRVLITRAKGASIGQALFESATFFNAAYFMSLLGLDNYHPLTRLKKFSEWYYSDRFPVSEFAKWLNISPDAVTGLCIDMAAKGFVFYDRDNDEVVIKKKVRDFLDSYAGKKDYDVLTVRSEVRAPMDNAVLDLKTFDMRVMGVRSVFLSDSQRVAIYPYNRELVITRNRGLTFDGVVQAGLFTIYGHDFRFSYDTFKIRLASIDSIRIAVETGKTDPFGNIIVRDVGNILQLTKGELYIDDPANKSGRKRLTQYPIINAMVPSYIYYDKIPGLEDVYRKEDFYFRIDPFTFENIDHFRNEDISLSGEFVAGNILKPMRQQMTVQENNSLGFEMNIPPEGVEVYDGRGKIFDHISMSNSGLIGRGTLRHLTSVTRSDEYRFFPDSMLARATVFNIENDGSGLFPELNSEDVKIKWLPGRDEWLAENAKEKQFNMFANGTILDGKLKLMPSGLSGSGEINMTDSKIVSNGFSFTSSQIRADTADYSFKSPSTSGYAFIAENANTEIDFSQQKAAFHLNTGSSFVRFPEIEYICTMTDFSYDMGTKILAMEQRGKSGSGPGLIPPEKLLALDMRTLEKPTFIAVNSLRDTISFAARKASYNVEKEYIEAGDINYIHIADALIQPENGSITINRKANISKLSNAFIAVNNRHLLHSANITIESARKYSGSAIYNYVDDSRKIHPITFGEITVDTLTTSGKGFIPENQNFMLSQAFTFSGDVSLSARRNNLFFTGSAGIVNSCEKIRSYTIKFRSEIDPGNVMIPIGEKPRDKNDNLVFSGSFLNIDSTHIYPAFLSMQKSWSDVGLVTASGVLYYNKSLGRYQIASVEKIADPGRYGNLVSLDRNSCILSGEGRLNFGASLDLVKMNTAGTIRHNTDSGKVNIRTIMALSFYFSPAALKMMADDIKLVPSLKTVNLNSEFNNKGMKDLYGESLANQLRDEVSLFGTFRNMPREFDVQLLLNDVSLYWNESSSSFRSTGRIGIGFIGDQALNVYVDGFIEIQRRRSGDLIDIYLKANPSTWYYFSYFRGVMMAQAGNLEFNRLLSSIKLKDRRHPQATNRVPYTYMIAVEDRLSRFLRRMSDEPDEGSSPPEGQIW
ncbi:MAG: hypothetical protein GT598_15160 [Bacteroidales bacterium]|mgnify:CR=1 FL=1|nr:hypothetical protein [Bacteroidales bacterium]HPM19053.1 hypothetical protein [Bacteroidales bacterium]